ncbi:hypothetical protein TNCV_2209291 [Trichonephila clavipes]|nr:hypothetical protein TNCV_2209291 [Trichonephila clavipes]
MRCFLGVPSCEKYRIQASPVPACGINEDLFACVRSAVFSDFQVSSARIPECSCVVLYKFEEVVKELRVEVDITLPKIEFRRIGDRNRRICESKYYDEESVKYLLEGISEERDQEFEERRLAREFERKKKSDERDRSARPWMEKSEKSCPGWRKHEIRALVGTDGKRALKKRA